MALSVVRLVVAGLLLVVGCACQSVDEGPGPEVLRVLTLNLHHGLGTGEHEDGMAEAAFRENLAAVAAVLKRETIHIAALQEADGPSSFSGNFDHVGVIAQTSGLEEVLHGLHCNRSSSGSALRCGTALVSRLPLTRDGGGTFPGTPRDAKGFVVASIVWEGRDLDVVSVDLHETYSAIRLDQVRLLVGELRKRGRPLVIMGDMNCTWLDSERTLRVLGEALGIVPYEPKDKGIITHLTAETGRRLDWILVSPEMEIRFHRVLPDLISEHLAVMAEIIWKKD